MKKMKSYRQRNIGKVCNCFVFPLENLLLTLSNLVFLKWFYAFFLLLRSLESATFKFGSGVDELEVSLLQSLPFGLYQQGLAECKLLLLGSHHIAFQHDKGIVHFTIVDKATQRVDALTRKIIINGSIVLAYFAILDEMSLANLVDLVDLSVTMVVFLSSLSHRESHGVECHAPIQAILCSPRSILWGSLLVCQELVTPL